MSMITFQKNIFFERLDQYCSDFEEEFHLISEERKLQLQILSEYISKKQKNQEVTRLIVICTHNSRRSHIGQLWLAAASELYGIKNVKTYSGGTEATAFNPRSVAALQRAGFEIVTSESGGENPTYYAAFGFSHSPLKMFYKVFDHEENPIQGFAAIMVCSDADENCPFVPGTEKRISITYDDPKDFDGTDLEEAKYDERVRQIGREMFYVLKVVRSQG